MSTNDARLTARLLSACPPDAAQKAKLENVLAKRYGRPVALSWQEDKTVSGGFRIEIGSEIIDWTAEGRLGQLKERLAALKTGGQSVIPLIRDTVRDWVPEISAREVGSVLSVADGIMVARGDMGVEIPFEELPAIQKKLITKCRLLGKRVITATEMLESMIHNPRPTRAEISDVANAVYDGTSAIMLSGETAAGKYPVEAVETMARIAETAEKGINYAARFAEAEFKIKNTVDALSHATCGLAIDMNAKVIAVCSLSGMTARMVSRFRSPVDILGLTTNERTWRKLALSWGVTPVLMEQYESIDVLFYQAKQAAIKTFRLRKGDRLILTGGMVNGTSGNTNLLKVETV